MTNDEMMNRAKDLVVKYHNEHSEVKITRADVYISWFSKTLQNWKALAGTDKVHNGMYYEITHNGDKNETYFDAYKKVENICIPD